MARAGWEGGGRERQSGPRLRDFSQVGLPACRPQGPSANEAGAAARFQKPWPMSPNMSHQEPCRPVSFQQTPPRTQGPLSTSLFRVRIEAKSGGPIGPASPSWTGEPWLSPGADTGSKGWRSSWAWGQNVALPAHLEDLLHDPAVVLLEGHLVGLGGVDADVVGVVLVPLPIADALQEDLDEAEASAAQRGDRQTAREDTALLPAAQPTPAARGRPRPLCTQHLRGPGPRARRRGRLLHSCELYTRLPGNTTTGSTRTAVLGPSSAP